MDAERLVLCTSFSQRLRREKTDNLQAGAIVTNRIILILSAQIISSVGSYYIVWPCAKVAYTMRSEQDTLEMYPVCESYFNGSSLQQQAVVHADFGSGKATEIAAAMNLCFGMALWVATAMHAIGVEVYVSS